MGLRFSSLGLMLVGSACSQAAFVQLPYACETSATCAPGFQCLSGLCTRATEDAGVSEDAGEPDAGSLDAGLGDAGVVDAGCATNGGRGNCPPGAFCDSTGTCDSICTAAFFNDFSQGPLDLYEMPFSRTGGAQRVNGEWHIEATVPDGGNAVFWASSGRRPAQPLRDCGISFSVAAFPVLSQSDGWQVMLRYQQDNNNYVGFLFLRDQMQFGITQGGQRLSGSGNVPIGLYRRFAVRAKGDRYFFYAAAPGQQWATLGQVDAPGLPNMAITMWVACYQNLGSNPPMPCVEGDSRRVRLSSYNVDFPPAP